MITEVVPEGLPVVLVLGLVEGVKGHWRSWRQILHLHFERLVHHSPRGVHGDNGGAGVRHAGESSVNPRLEMFGVMA